MAAWLEKHHPIATTDLLPTAGGAGSAKVMIELTDNPDDLEARRKKEAEAESTRQQNALPSWIERSTITGELTAVGAAQTSGRSVETAIEKDGVSSPKKAVTTADDEVDSYYAALAAAQAAHASSSKLAPVMKKDGSLSDGASTQHGSPSSGLALHSKLVDSGYEEFGEDNFSVVSPASPGNNSLSPASKSAFDTSRSHSRIPSLRPPSVASISNSLGKRSREPSEESEGEKRARTVAHDRSAEDTPPVVASPLYMKEEEEEDTIADDPILTGGSSKKRDPGATAETICL